MATKVYPESWCETVVIFQDDYFNNVDMPLCSPCEVESDKEQTAFPFRI